MIGTMGRDEYEERYGEEVGTCNIHRVQIVDRRCPQCEDEWVCSECNEVRYDDPRIENGMKCFICTYEHKGGE